MLFGQERLLFLLAWHVDAVLFSAFGAAVMLFVAHRRRRSGASRRLAGITILANILLVVSGVLLAVQSGERAKHEVRRVVEGLAPTYAEETRLLGIEEITLATPPDDPLYLRLIEAQKRWLRTNEAVADIYVFAKRPADSQNVLLVDSETDYDRDGVYTGEREARTAIGEVYEESDEALERAFRGVTTFLEEPVTDRWGTWLSAFAPIRARDGKVHSVLGVDFPAEEWCSSVLRARGSQLLLFGFVLSALAGIALLAFEHEARSKADAVAQERSRFLAHMSHEIRTPMTAILGYTQLLAEPDLDAAQRQEYLSTVQRCGNHLLGLLNSILDMAKLEAGQMQVERIAFGMESLCEDVLAIARPLAAARNLTFRHTIAAEVPRHVTSDLGKVRQILLNLVSNAIKFTATGGVELHVDLVPRDAGTPGHWLRFRVVDTGIGIAPATLDRLFDPFVQGDASIARVHGGTGLGLAISRQAAHLLGGEIHARSAPGSGSTFTLRIPLEPAAAGEVEVERASPVKSEALVLLVEDGKDNQKLVARVLERAGIRVEIVENGAECLDRVADGSRPKPDLILMDVQMPVMDGRTATHELRATGSDIPILALTAHATEDERTLCLEAGADGFLTKPIDLKHFVASVRAALR